MTTTAGHDEVIAQLRAAAARASTDDEVKAVTARIRAWTRTLAASRWQPYPWQRPHHHPDGWVSQRVPGQAVCDDRCLTLPRATPGVHEAWLQRGGRGTGKTEGAAHYVNTHAQGPPCDTRVPGGHRFTIVAPTQPDAVSSCVTGVSGLQAINPGVTVTTTKEGTIVRWPNGAVGRVLGAHEAADVERARAWTNVCLWWLEEAAAQPHLGGMLKQAPFTLRLGPVPHMVITTTPRNRPEVAKLIDGTGADLDHIPRAPIQTWGRTEDATRLPAAIRDSYETMFRGSTLGRQELDGELLADTAGALWVHHRPDLVDGEPNTDERPGVDNDRIQDPTQVGWKSHLPGMDVNPLAPIQMERVIIAVDPPGGRTECGITVEARSGGHGYTLADLSLAGPPDTWAMVALHAYLLYGAEGIAAEHAYGGDMVTDAIQSRITALQLLAKLPPAQRPPSYFDWPEALGTPPIFRVPTKVGKRLRAEPVQALYQQHRVHHVGLQPGLEAEQCSWEPGVSTDSPNRVDAHVHGQTFLLIRAGTGHVGNPAGIRIPGR